MPEFGGGEEHGKIELLHGGIIDLRWIKISTEVKNSLLSPGIIVLGKEAADGLFSRRDI